MAAIDDKVFGKLDYNEYGWWERELSVKFLGREKTCFLMIDGDEDYASFDAGQNAAYENLMKKWDDTQSHVAAEILDYYKTERSELGYAFEEFDSVNEIDGATVEYGKTTFPKIESVDELADHIELDSIHIMHPGSAEILEKRHGGKRVAALRFSVSWDEENGLGVILVGEEAKEINQDAGL